MAKDMKSNSLFGTELNGFKKKQVNEYIAELEKRHRANLKAYEEKNQSLADALAASEKRYAELLSQYNELQGEKARFADILINAEKSAEKIKENARQEAEAEKNTLLDETETLRQTIVHRNVVLRDIKNSSETMIEEMLSGLLEASETFQNRLREEQKKLSASVTELNDKYALYYSAEETVPETENDPEPEFSGDSEVPADPEAPEDAWADAETAEEEAAAPEEAAEPAWADAAAEETECAEETAYTEENESAVDDGTLSPENEAEEGEENE